MELGVTPETCSIKGCERRERAAGLCARHYQKRSDPDGRELIHPKRKNGEAEKLLALTVSRHAAERIRAAAAEAGTSAHAVIVGVLERWAAHR